MKNNISINNYNELQQRIAAVRLKKVEEETQLKNSIKEYSKTFSPTYLIKKSLHNLANDNEVQTDFAKVTLNTGIDFIIGKILGKYSSVKGFLSASIAERISRVVLNEDTNQWAVKAIDALKALLQKNETKEELDNTKISLSKNE